MEPTKGLEPLTCCLRNRWHRVHCVVLRASCPIYLAFLVQPVHGVHPCPPAWLHLGYIAISNSALRRGISRPAVRPDCVNSIAHCDACVNSRTSRWIDRTFRSFHHPPHPRNRMDEPSSHHREVWHATSRGSSAPQPGQSRRWPS